MSVTVSGTNGLTFNDGSSQQTAASGFGFKNRIINGAMMIDQRNAGASVANVGGAVAYTVDRFAYYASQASKFTIQQNAGSVTPPVGFSSYLGVSSSSAYSVGSGELFTLYQPIEGLNASDLGWGSANAATVTLSFWVRSSLTGTFGGALQNSANNRSYPYAYTINSANTWEQKTIVIAGDTSGTWLTTNGIGVIVRWNLGAGSTLSGTAGSWAGANYVSATGATSVVGTSGATFYITGVQLEKGSTATSFDYRPFGTELALCQRYYWSITGGASSYPAVGSGVITASTIVRTYVKFPVSMRDYATIGYSGSLTGSDGANSGSVSSIGVNGGGKDSALVDFTCSGAAFGTLRGGIVYLSNATTNTFYGSAEL